MSEPDLSALIVLGLACWRLANMLVNELGPLDIFDRLRGVANRIPGVDDLFACIYCMSVWTALLMVWLWQSQTGRNLVNILAVSAVTLCIHESLKRLQKSPTD